MSRSDELGHRVAASVLTALGALGSGDRNVLASTLSDGVELLLPDRPAKVGRDVVADALLDDASAGAEIDETEVSGNLGIVRWRRPATGGEERRGLCVVTRGASGGWEISRWIENRGETPVPVVDRPTTPAPSGPGFRVTLLGHPRVTVASDLTAAGDDEPEVQWPFQRALEILAFLALAQSFEAARDELVEAVWAEASEESIEKNFHPSVSHVRGALTRAWRDVFDETLPRPLVYEGGLYRLHRDVGWWVDVAEVARHLEWGRRQDEAGDLAGAVRHWEAGLRLCRGSLLEGIYSPWTSLPRDRVQRVYLDLLEAAAGAYAELDRLTEAMDAYRRLLFEDPLRERVHVALMQTYARQGRRDLVRRQYDRLTELLQEELGVQPLPQTTEEYHRVMR